MNNLSQRIWKTRKIRINTESRLNKMGIIFDLLVPLYSLNFIIITILPIQKKDNWITFVSIAGSLVILIISILASNRNYKIRAYKMRLHYIKLDDLYTKLNMDDRKVEEVYSEYQKELLSVENHSDGDYLKTIIDLKNDNGSGFPKVKISNYIKFYSIKILHAFIVIILFMLPIFIDIMIAK